MVGISKLSTYRLPRVLVIIGVLVIALAVGVYYWPATKLEVAGLIQQMTRIQERLVLTDYTIYKRLSEQQWAKWALRERDWLVRSWLVWGGLAGVVLPVIVFLVTYGSRWWRLLLPPSPSRDSGEWGIVRLIQRKVLQAHWRTSRFKLEQAVLNVLVLGLSCFSLQLIIHSYILPSRSLMRAGLLSYIGFSYACFFFCLYIKRCSLRQAAGMLDERLRLKQELVTSLDIQPTKHSRLGHFLLTDTAAKIEYKSIPQLFPHHSHRLKASFFFLQLGLILLATMAITLGGPQLVSSYYSKKGSAPLPAKPRSRMEGLISQQAQQIRALSRELEQRLSSPQLQEVASELELLAEELLALEVLGIGKADAGNNYQGVLMPDGSQLAVAGIEEAGLGASAEVMVSPEGMERLMASFNPRLPNPYQSMKPPPIPQAQPENSKQGEMRRMLGRASTQLAQIAQRLSGLNGGESRLKSEPATNGVQGGMEAKEADGNDSSLKTAADRLAQLAHKLKQAQLPTSAQVIKDSLWLKGEQLAQLAQKLSQWEAAENDAQKASTEDKTGKVAGSSPADLGKQRSEIRMVSFELNKSARRLKEWDAIIRASMNQQERVQLVPYSGQYGSGEASIISGKKSEPFSPELTPRPRLRIGGESSPHFHAQVTNISLNNTYRETNPEQEQSRRAIIARGYNQGSSPRPAQVKLGQGQREQPPSGVAQRDSSPQGLLTPAQRLAYLPASTFGKELSTRERQRLNADELDYTLTPGEKEKIKGDQYGDWEQWGKKLELASQSLAELADRGLKGNTDGSGDSGPAYQPQAESAALSYLGNQLGRLSAQLYNRLDDGADVSSGDKGEKPGVNRGLNRLQDQAQKQLAEQLGSLSQKLLGLAQEQRQAAGTDGEQRQLTEGLIKDDSYKYEVLKYLAQDLGLISQGLGSLSQLSPQKLLELQGLEDSKAGKQLETNPGDFSDHRSRERQEGNADAGQMGNMQQQASEVPTGLRQWARELDGLSTELVNLAKDERERRLLAKHQLRLRDYKGDRQNWVSTKQAVDPQSGNDQNGNLSRLDNMTGRRQSLNLKLKTELQELADELEELTESRKGIDGWSEPAAIIEKGIQKISQLSSELKSQVEPFQQSDRIANELDQLAQGLSQLQPSLPISFPHLGGGALPTGVERLPSPQIPAYQTDGGVDSFQAQDGNGDSQNHAIPLAQPQGSPQDRIKQQLALMKLNDLIHKLRQQQAVQTATDETSSRKGTTGTSHQQLTDFSKGVNQQDDPKGGTELERSPDEETISSPYPMEKDLTQPEVFERIIRRLAKSRNRIAQFTIPSPPLAHNLPHRLKSRRGNFPQPPNLPEMRELTLWEQQRGVLRRKIAKPPSPFPPNQLISFRDPQEVGKYAQVSTRTRVTHSYNYQPRPGILLLATGQLSLPANQAADNSVQQQLIPQSYQEIIQRLYQPD